MPTARSRTMRPSSITSTRSARMIASSTSCVTSSTVGRWTRSGRSSSACIRMRVSASSAPKGSSASSSCGSRTSERASATRCCSPPESAFGQASSRPAEADIGERRPPALGRIPIAQAEDDVLEHALPGQQPRILEQHRPVSGHLDRPVPSTSSSRPAMRAQQRALAGAAPADQRHELARRDVERDIVQHGAAGEAPASGCAGAPHRTRRRAAAPAPGMRRAHEPSTLR